MSFQVTIRRRYPGAVRQREYVSLATSALHEAGFGRENTLVAVSHCRDELTSSVRSDIEASWGSAFELSGLAGLLSAGTTGMSAALSHLPNLGDQAGFVVFAFAHVGIDGDGTIGSLRRPGMDQPTSTCGSLAGVLKARGRSRVGRAEAEWDTFDLEQTNVSRRIGELLPTGPNDPTPDLADLANLALRCIEADIDTIFDRLVGGHRGRPLGVDGGLFTGVQIHGPDDQTYVWPSIALIDAGGVVGEALPELVRAAAAEQPTISRASSSGAEAKADASRADGGRDPSRHQPRHTEHQHFEPGRSHTEHAHTEHSHTEHAHTEHSHTEHSHTEHSHTEHSHTEHAHTDHGRWNPEVSRRTRSTPADPTDPLGDGGRGLLGRFRRRTRRDAT